MVTGTPRQTLPTGLDRPFSKGRTLSQPCTCWGVFHRVALVAVQSLCHRASQPEPDRHGCCQPVKACSEKQDSQKGNRGGQAECAVMWLDRLWLTALRSGG